MAENVEILNNSLVVNTEEDETVEKIVRWSPVILFIALVMIASVSIFIK